MALERFLLTKDPSSSLFEKSREIDKIDFRAVSFFAALAESPASTSLKILSGYAYIDKTFVTIPDTTIGLGVGGSHQVGAVPANNYNVALFSLSKTGTILKVEGTPGASPGAVVEPAGGFPIGSLPLCKVLFQDNGTGGIGTINVLQQSAITDARGFFFGNYDKATFAGEIINDFKVTAQATPNKTVTVEKGNLYFNSGEFAELLTTQVLDFGSGPFLSPTIPANQYNKVLISFTTFGTLVASWGVPAVTANGVVLGALPKDAFPLALITVKDNGSSVPGSINNVAPSDVKDVRPFFNNFFGTLPVENLSYCRVIARFPPDRNVVIKGGVVYPQGILYTLTDQTINFQNPGPYQFPATTPGHFRIALIGINAAGLVYFTISPSALTENAVVKPVIPPSIIPLAYVTLRDDGTGVAGSCLPVEPQVISDIRPFLGALGSSGGTEVVQKNDLYHNFLEESFFKQSYYENYTEDAFIDLPNTTGDIDIIIDNEVVLGPGEKITSINVYDSFYGLANVANALAIVDASTVTGLVCEASNNGGTNWEVMNITNPNPANLHTFATVGNDLRLRVTNTSGADITLLSWGIHYNDDPMIPSYMSYIKDNGRKLRKILTTIKDNAYVDTLNINQLSGDLYKAGTGALLNNGNKTLAAAYSFQGLLAPVKAVVGPNGTHTTLAAAIADVSPGALILIDTTNLVLGGVVNVNKADLTIMGCGRGTVISGNNTFVGLNITSQGVKIKGCKLSNFTTGVKVAAENCMVLENYFSGNTVDVDYSGITRVVVESNISE